MQRSYTLDLGLDFYHWSTLKPRQDLMWWFDSFTLDVGSKNNWRVVFTRAGATWNAKSGTSMEDILRDLQYIRSELGIFSNSHERGLFDQAIAQMTA